MNSPSALAILVHGLWMAGPALSVIKRRLEAGGSLRAVLFSYPSTLGSMRDHVRRLIDFAQAQRCQQLHFVGHSLGGLVVLRALEITDDLPPGRAVLLGSPLQGSRTAQRLARVSVGRAMLGRALIEECVECSQREWSGRREVGVIAGSLRFGLGRVLGELGEEHDGTVRVAETRLPGARDHIVVHTSHTGMLLSAEVARQTRYFLEHGRFERDGSG